MCEHLGTSLATAVRRSRLVWLVLWLPLSPVLWLAAADIPALAAEPTLAVDNAPTLNGTHRLKGAIALESDTAGGATPAALSLRDALILGCVEGATEYLPVSSTGHLLIVQELLGLSSDNPHAAAADSLAICIQGGAILAVLLLYRGRLQQLLRGLIGRDADGRRLLLHLLVAFLPAAVCGLLLHDWIKSQLFGIYPVALALFAGGLLILLNPGQSAGGSTSAADGGTVDAGRELTELRWQDALLIGCMQCLALWPGFSRSLAAILGCRRAGLKLSAAVEFSFLLGLVTLTAATAYEGLKHGDELVTHYGLVSPLVALTAAFVSAAFSVHVLIRSLARWGLTPFGYYRILLAIVCLMWLA